MTPQNVCLLVFFNVLLEQAGLPVPAVPSLALAGGLFAKGDLLLGAGSLVGLAVLACLLADSLWYWAGRRYGTAMMRLACKVSATPDSCTARSRRLYLRAGPKLLLVAKFLPGAGALSTLMAGAAGTGFRTFLIYDAAGAALWSGSAIALGLLFGDVVIQALALFKDFAALGGLALAGLLAMLIVWRLARRRAAYRRSPRVRPGWAREGQPDALVPEDDLEAWCRQDSLRACG
jgi:membrane protein DedA with SNARE-associated domain